MADRTHSRRRLNLSSWILIALVAGISLGLFLGELTSVLKPVADGFIRLLQMAVLPYIMTSLIASLGRLTHAQAGFVARQGGLLLALLWCIALIIVLAFPLAFPEWKAASFFSSSLVQPPQSFDFVELFIPANFFRSAADNVVPAVVLFSIALGVALMTVPRREVLIENLDILSSALTKITNFAVLLTPFGVFAIAASTAGTLSIEEFGRLQVYVLTYSSLALLVTLWILPGLVAVLTPFSYREVLRASREALLTAFSTGSLLVVLPLIAERAKELLRQLGKDRQTTDDVVDVLVPVSFNFPTVGKLLTLGFILFAAWFTGTDLSLSQYPVFLTAGLLTFFGSVNAALPFLLDQLRIPSDMFQLFVAIGFLNFRFATLMSTMHTLVLSLLAACAVGGVLQVQWFPLVRYASVSVLALLLLLFGMRLTFESFGGSYQAYELLTERELSTARPPARVFLEAPPEREERLVGSVLDAIRERGILRVSYVGKNLPMTYFNSKGDLVGFDIEMAHQLALDLGVSLEFVPADPARIPDLLERGDLDLVMTRAVTPYRARLIAYTNPYMKPTLAFVVADHLRHEFGSRRTLRRLDGLVIAVPGSSYYTGRLREYLPRAEVVLIRHPEEFFGAEPGRFDAMLYPAEMASAWTLLYPEYSVAIPHPDVVKMSLAYVTRRGDPDFLTFLNTWIDFQTTNGRVDQLYNYWILGKQESQRQPRWSVIRDVLHWIE